MELTETEKTRHVIASSQVHRISRHVLGMLQEARQDPMTERQREDLRSCLLTIASIRDLNPTDNPGMHEAAVRRYVDAVVEQDKT